MDNRPGKSRIGKIEKEGLIEQEVNLSLDFSHWQEFKNEIK